MNSINNKNHSINKETIFLIISFISCSLFIIIFTLLLRHDLTSLRLIDKDNYSISIPENFNYNLEISENEESFTIKGYSIILDERSEYVNNSLVVYNEKDDIYIQIPTSMDFYSDIILPETGNGYEYGKFISILVKEDLTLPLTEYKLGFLYKTNNHNNLILTNQTLIGG